MSLELEHAYDLARALVISGELGRASAQLGRLKTLDAHGAMDRRTAFLSVVLAVRGQSLVSAESELAALAPMSERELRDLGEMLGSTPEAIHPDYQRWVQRFLRKSDATGAARQARWRTSVAMPLLAGGAVILAIMLVMGAVFALRPKQRNAAEALDLLIMSLNDGDFVAAWDGLPATYKSEGDAALHALAARIPAKALEDFRAVDHGLSALVHEHLPLLRGSSLDSVGPYFRSMSGEDDARALARYFQARCDSAVYEPGWLVKASTRDVLAELTSGDFQRCWRTYFRTPTLKDPWWQVLLGFGESNIGDVAGSPHTFVIAEPDDGSGRVVVAILRPGGQRVDVTMRLVEGCWVPEPLFNGWRLAMLIIQSDRAMADSWVSRFFPRIASMLDPKRADARKLAIIDAQRARSQKEFDDAATSYLGD